MIFAVRLMKLGGAIPPRSHCQSGRIAHGANRYRARDNSADLSIIPKTDEWYKSTVLPVLPKKNAWLTF